MRNSYNSAWNADRLDQPEYFYCVHLLYFLLLFFRDLSIYFKPTHKHSACKTCTQHMCHCVVYFRVYDCLHLILSNFLPSVDRVRIMNVLYLCDIHYPFLNTLAPVSLSQEDVFCSAVNNSTKNGVLPIVLGQYRWFFNLMATVFLNALRQTSLNNRGCG
jgi:hypothetical protein